MTILKDWIGPIASILTSLLLTWIAFRAYWRDRPGLLLELLVPKTSQRGEGMLVILITNVGYRNSALRSVYVDGKDIFKEFIDPSLYGAKIQEKQDLLGTCLEAGRSLNFHIWVKSKHVAKLARSKYIHVEEMNGKRYEMPSKNHQRLIKNLRRDT